MNKEWSELNKQFQKKINNKNTFNEGILDLLELRKKLFEALNVLKSLSIEEMSLMPFINQKGYQNKTIAYSIYHIARIEDIVCHTLIVNEEEIFFRNDYKNRLNSKIITTGNELKREEISKFSIDLNSEELFKYIEEVYLSTNQLLKSLDYKDLRTSFTDTDKDRITNLKVVSDDLDAVWLIDYWCNKDVKGLLQMPFSRHWLMHIEAALRIFDKINDSKIV